MWRKKKAAKAAALSFTRISEGDDHIQLLRSPRVVLVVIDALAHTVGLAVELALVLLGEVAVVLRHVLLLIVLEALFAAFETARLALGQLAALFALSDAGLLAGLATVDLIDARMTRIDLSRAGAGCVAGLSLSSGGSGNHQTTHCQDKE